MSEHEPQPQITIREVTSAKEVASARRVQKEGWLLTYPNEEANVSKEWVEQRTLHWLDSDKLVESEKILESVLRDPTQFYRVAEMNGEIAGSVHLVTKDNGQKHLEAIYISPQVFGTGVGAQLMEAGLAWAGKNTTTLEVATYNDRAQHFYRKYDFHIVEGSQYLYADKIPVITMVRLGETQ